MKKQKPKDNESRKRSRDAEFDRVRQKSRLKTNHDALDVHQTLHGGLFLNHGHPSRHM